MTAAEFASGQEPRKFKGTAYGGGIISDHGMWDRVIFDLRTTKAPDRMPVLLDHDSGQIVGYTASVEVGESIRVEGVVTDGEAGRKVADQAAQGFPWQMSVRIMPETIVRLDDNEMMSVNGREVKGPASVFKDSLIREVSFCALGADRDTEANVFNMKEARMETKPAGQDRDLAIQALSDERAALKAETETLKGRVTEFASANAELKGQVKALEFEGRSLKESLEAARKEAEEARARFQALRLSSRSAILEEDYRRLNMKFSAEDAGISAVIQAEDAVFEAFRKALGEVKSPTVPPEGAFVNMTGGETFGAAPSKTLSERAKERKELKEGKNGN
jgi:outer membrane murein-binding lipoprotein Lpp